MGYLILEGIAFGQWGFQVELRRRPELRIDPAVIVVQRCSENMSVHGPMILCWYLDGIIWKHEAPTFCYPSCCHLHQHQQLDHPFVLGISASPTNS